MLGDAKLILSLFRCDRDFFFIVFTSNNSYIQTSITLNKKQKILTDKCAFFEKIFEIKWLFLP